MGLRNRRPSSKNRAALTYSKYLKIDELISLQAPLATPTAHDELLFIVIHQTYELWFKQILHELQAAINFIEVDALLAAHKLMDRIEEILRVLIQQVDILETMTPVEFNRFRSHLKPASGFQSEQFRELELLSGGDPGDLAPLLALEPEWKNAIMVRVAKGTLRQALVKLLIKRKLMKNADGLEAALIRIYAEANLTDLQQLCEDFIRYDEQVCLWRFRHVQMVERMIGMKMGTGGSLGVPYLQQTLKKKFFPELWAIRTSMGEEY